MADAVSTEAGRIDIPTAPSTSDTGSLVLSDTEIPEEIELIDALNRVYHGYLAAPLTDPLQKADREDTQEAWEETLAKGVYQFSPDELRDNSGKGQPKFLPMHGMIDWLADNPSEQNKEDLSILERFNESIRAKDLRRKETDEEVTARHNRRIEQEKAWMRRKGLSTGDEEKDTAIATKRVQKVLREIIPVRAKGKPKTSTPVESGQVPAASLVPGTEAEHAPGEAVADASSIEDLASASAPEPETTPDELPIAEAEAPRPEPEAAAAVADTPAPEPDPAPVETALPEPAEATEKPIEITDFHLGMNFIDISSGEMVYVSNIKEKSYLPELADLTENEVTLTNLRTGETQTIIREKLLEQIRNGEEFKPDPIEGGKYKDTKTGKILTAQTDFKDGRPRVNLVDETGKIVGTGKRQGFDEAVANGDYEEVKPAPKPIITPPPTPAPIVSLTSPSSIPAITPALPPAPFAPATPGIAPATPSPAPALIETLTAEAPVAPEPADNADVEKIIDHFATAESSVASPRHSKTNEDAVFSSPEHGIIAVFDGLGGVAGGEIASHIARDEMSKALLALPPNATRDEIYQAMVNGLTNARNAMNQYEADHPEQEKGMDTTITLIKLYREGDDLFAYMMHAGDSRAYAYTTSGNLRQVSTDDSFVSQALEEGSITKERAEEINRIMDEAESVRDLPDDVKPFYSQRNVMTNTFRYGPKLNIVKLGPHVKYLIVTSDGIHDNLKASEIGNIVGNASVATDIPQALVEGARELFISFEPNPDGTVRVIGPKRNSKRSKEDDTSAVVIDLSPDRSTLITPASTPIISPTSPGALPAVAPVLPSAPEDEPSDASLAVDTLDSSQPLAPEPRPLNRRERLNASARGTLDRLDRAIERMRTTTAYPILPTDSALVRTFKDVGRAVEGAVIKPTSILFLNSARLATKTVSKVIDPFAPKLAKPLPEYQPTTPTSLNPKRTFIIANQSSDLSSPQELQVSEFINQEMKKGFWNWPKKIGLNWLEALAKKRVADQIRAASIKSGNPYVVIAMDQSKLRLRDLFLTRNLLWRKRDLPQLKLDTESRRNTATTASESILKQLQTEVGAGQELVQAQGELRQMLLDKIIHPLIKEEITDPLKVQELLREFVINKKNDPQVQAIFGRNTDRYGRLAEYFATNLIELTSEMKREINAGGTSLAVLDNEIDLRFARIRGRDQTERNLSITDKLIERAEGNRITGFVANPAVVSIASALALRFALKPTSRGAGASIVPIAGGILAGSIWGAIEGGYKVKVDRTTRQSGRTFMKNGEALRPPILRSNRPLERARYKAALIIYNRQASIEKGFETTDYERVPASELKTKLRNLLDTGNKSDPRVREEVIDAIAEIRARLDFYDLNGIHKISYDSEDVTHQQNLDLVELRAEARTVLRNEGLSDDQIITAERDAYGRYNQKFIENTEQQDRAFAAFRLKEMAIRGGIGAGIGAAAASATVFAADFVEHVSGFNPLREFNRAVRNTFGGVSSEIASFVPRLKDAFSHGGTVNVTDHLQAVVNADSHGVRFVNPTGETMLRGQILPDGKIAVPGNISGVRSELEQAFDIHQESAPSEPLIPLETELVRDNTLGKPIKIPEGTHWVPNSEHPKTWNLVSDTDPNRILVSEGRYDKKGVFHFNESASPWAEGVETTKGERVKVTGKEGLWHDASTDVDRREWYRNNTVGRSEGNELRLTTGKKGNAVILSMHGMGLGTEEGLKPNPIDVRELKNKGFFITLGGNYDKPIWIPVGADGVMDAKLRLDPDDYTHFITRNGNKIYLGDIARMVINEEAFSKLPDGNIATELYGRRDVFSIANNGRNGAIEAGRLIRRDGQNVAQIFATILGNDETPKYINRPSEILIRPFEITKPPVQPPIVLIPRDIEAPPIPIVYAPRFTLGNMTQSSSEPRENIDETPEASAPLPTGTSNEQEKASWQREFDQAVSESDKRKWDEEFNQTIAESTSTPGSVPLSPPPFPAPILPPQAQPFRPVESSVPEGFTAGPPVISAPTPYTGPEPRASGRLTPEWRARQREIDRENALARRTGRAAVRTGVQVASATARAGVGTARVTARAAQSTARLGTKTASGVALGIGQAAERIPQGVTDAVSPLTSVGYGGGVIPRVTPAAPSPTPEPIPTTGATVASPPTPATVPPPAPESVLPITAGVGTTVYSTNGSEYRIVDEETIAGVKLFNLQPVDGNPNIRSSVAEKDLLNPTQFSRFRLAKIIPEPGPVASAPIETPIEVAIPIPDSAETPPSKTYPDEEGKIYELMELDDHGARVKYPDGAIHYLPRNLFDLYTSGEFFNPNAVLPPTETPPLETVTPTPEPGIREDTQGTASSESSIIGKTYEGKKGGVYEVVGIRKGRKGDVAAVEVRFPDGSVKIIAQYLFNKWTSGRFFDPYLPSPKSSGINKPSSAISTASNNQVLNKAADRLRTRAEALRTTNATGPKGIVNRVASTTLDASRQMASAGAAFTGGRKPSTVTPPPTINPTEPVLPPSQPIPPTPLPENFPGIVDRSIGGNGISSRIRRALRRN